MSLAKAEDYFELTERLWPQLIFVDSKLLEVAVLKGDDEKALAKAREMVDEGQTDPKAYYVLVADAQRRGDKEQAEKYLKIIETLQPNALEHTEVR